MPVKEGRKILFLWARFAFSSDGIKGQSRPKLVSQSIFGIHRLVLQLSLGGPRPFRLWLGFISCFCFIVILPPVYIYITLPNIPRSDWQPMDRIQSDVKCGGQGTPPGKYPDFGTEHKNVL